MSDLDAGGISNAHPKVEMLPRSYWEHDPRFVHTFSADLRESIRRLYECRGLAVDTGFITFTRARCGVPNVRNAFVLFDSRMCYQTALRRVEIVEVLTSATTGPNISPMRLLGWCEEHSEGILSAVQTHRIASEYWANCAAIFSARAVDDVMTYFTLSRTDLDFRARLVGLQGAAHLNRREGFTRSCDEDSRRFMVRLDKGKEVSVKIENVEHVRGMDYKPASCPISTPFTFPGTSWVSFFQHTTRTHVR